MADYNATARTNYFRVKDVGALRDDLHRHGIGTAPWSSQGYGGDLVLDDDENNKPEGAVALFSTADHGTWPSVDPDDEEITLRAGELGMACNAFETFPEDGPEESNPEDPTCDACRLPKSKHGEPDPDWTFCESIIDIVARHLIDGDVAVFQEVGSEKMRYVGGVSVAVNSKGETVRVDLDDIYEKAKALGENVTVAAY